MSDSRIYTKLNSRIIVQSSDKLNLIKLGLRVHALFQLDHVVVQISFVPTYVVNEDSRIFLGVKNDLISSHKGYYPVSMLTGSDQIDIDNLSHIHL